MMRLEYPHPSDCRDWSDECEQTPAGLGIQHGPKLEFYRRWVPMDPMQVEAFKCDLVALLNGDLLPPKEDTP
jgi:hypothetical protein